MAGVALMLPGGGGDDFIELVVLDAERGLWGGCRPDGPDAYGTAAEVIAVLSGRPAADGWVREAAAAVSREETWGSSGGWRRPWLEVVAGRGAVYHATATVNRTSIRQHGLDWRRMGAACGIAGSTRPELPAVFVCADREDVSFFLRMARSSSDVWCVDVEGLWLESGPNGWWIISQPVPRDRLRLVGQDIPVSAAEPFG
jgi:hypothetical protein